MNNSTTVEKLYLILQDVFISPHFQILSKKPRNHYLGVEPQQHLQEQTKYE